MIRSVIDLGQIACPTLIVWGAEDKLVPARDADEFARLIPNARKVVWPQTGHVAMLVRRRLVGRHPPRDLVVVERDVQSARRHVDRDDVPVAERRDRAAVPRLRARRARPSARAWPPKSGRP